MLEIFFVGHRVRDEVLIGMGPAHWLGEVGSRGHGVKGVGELPQCGDTWNTLGRQTMMDPVGLIANLAREGKYSVNSVT